VSSDYFVRVGWIFTGFTVTKTVETYERAQLLGLWHCVNVN